MNYISAMAQLIESKDKAFQLNWRSLILSLTGKWGRTTWKPIPSENCTYYIIKDVVYFTWHPIARGELTLELPSPCADNGILLILSDGIISAKPIFKLDKSIQLNLAGSSILISTHYEGVTK